MATKKQLLSAYKKVEDAENKLIVEAQVLSRIASEYLGYEVNAELCAGSEIEFRRIGDDGLSDYSCTIRLEDII
jgi:hypothetical protein